MSNWTRTTRAMLRAADEVGAKPFILFQYYLTWQNAKDGIFPSLKRISSDLGLQPSAVCNLRKRLENAGWIQVKNDAITILKSFTKNEETSQDMKETFTESEGYSQKMKSDSQNMNTDSQKMNFSIRKRARGENLERRIRKKKEQRAKTLEEIITDLSGELAYSHINVSNEASKAQLWIAKNPGRQFTEKFFTGWLNRIPAPLASNGNGNKPKGCTLCLENEYVKRMSLKPGEIYNKIRNVVTRCECVK